MRDGQVTDPHVSPDSKERIPSYANWQPAVWGSVTYFVGHKETTECPVVAHHDVLLWCNKVGGY